MADSNPTGNRMAVPLRTPERHRGFLRDTLSACLRGIESDLENPDQHPDPARAQREADAYRRLLAAIDTGSIIPDPELRPVVMALLDSVDDANEYGRVLLEHAALVGLFDQVGGGRS